MRKFLIAFLVFGSVLSFGSDSQQTETLETTKVYICDSSGGKKCHYTKDCRGLNACKHEIKKVTLEEAMKKGKKELCGWED